MDRLVLEDMANRTKSPEGPRKTQIKFYVTRPFKDEVDGFLADHRELGSMGDFGIAALRFFMTKYREAGFVRGRDDFPVAAEHQDSYDLRRPIRKKHHD